MATEFDPPRPISTAHRKVFTFVVATYFVACLVAAGHLANEFGLGPAAILSFLAAMPMFLAAQMLLRANKVSEYAYLLILAAFICGGVILLVSSWYDASMHLDHAEDLRYSKLRRLMRTDPAFQNVEINLSERKHIYWLSGKLSTDADLVRLHAMAAQRGIKDRRLEGPYADSESLTVEDGR